MTLNLEGFRIELARAMYEDSIGGLKGAPGWFEQDPEVRDGFIKLAAVALQKMWEKKPHELVQFFAGHMLQIAKGCGAQIVRPDRAHKQGSNQFVNICGIKTVNNVKRLCNDCKVKALLNEEN